MHSLKSLMSVNDLIFVFLKILLTLIGEEGQIMNKQFLNTFFPSLIQDSINIL